jgi:ribonucleoside-diphosphate reductase alpha chain
MCSVSLRQGVSLESMLDRGDLAHVQPGDLMPDTVGKGEAESNLIRRAASNGFVRNKLTVLDGGAGRATALAAFADPDIDGPLALSRMPEGTAASSASAPPASRATKATAAPNAATLH